MQKHIRAAVAVVMVSAHFYPVPVHSEPTTEQHEEPPSISLSLEPYTLSKVEIGKSYATLEEEKIQEEKKKNDELKKKEEAKKVAPKPKTYANVPTTSSSRTTGPEPIVASITKWAAHYGVPVERLLRIAKCESGYNPKAVNRGYYAGGGNPSGLFQYLPSTFRSYSKMAGLENADIWDYEAQAHVTAWAFANGKSGAWECK